MNLFRKFLYLCNTKLKSNNFYFLKTMKKALLFLSALLLCFMGFSKNVDVANARLVATNFWNMNSDRECPDLVEVSTQLGLSEMYVFVTITNDGFVIVAADDIARPILGYSTSNGISDNHLSANLRGWLNHYSGEIQSARAAGYMGNDETDSEWHNLLFNIYPKSGNGRKVVTPLLQTQWSQSDPYNSLCPYDNNGHTNTRSVTGCGATALAQVLKYWNWPLKGVGSKTYTCSTLSDNAPTHTISANFDTTYYWNRMPAGGTITPTNTWAYAQKAAVALLMFHCGVSLEMGYRWNESSAYSSAYANALKNHFVYSNSMSLKYKSSYTETNWSTLVKDELDAKRPLLYCGWSEDGSGGHAFVCDGYDASGKFHFNWGWSSAGDGYYPLSGLLPTQTGTGAGLGDYSYNQLAVFNVMPAIQTYSSFRLNSNTVAIGNTLTGTCGFKHSGVATFKGYLGVAAYNSSDQFVTILSQTDFITFSGGGTKTLAIDYTAAPPIVAGEYTAKAVCSVDGSTWYPIHYGYNNCATEVSFTVTGESPIPISDPELQVCNSYALNSSTYELESVMTGSCGIKNVGSGAFSGLLGIAAYTATGTLVTMIKQSYSTLDANASTNIPIAYTVTSPLTVGTYIARPVYSIDNGVTWNQINYSADNTPTQSVFSVTLPANAEPELKVCNGFSFTNSSVSIGQPLVGTCGIRNTSPATFNGMIGVAAYDREELFLTVMSQQSVNMTTDAVRTINISYVIPTSFQSGNYIARPVYSTDNGVTWDVIGASYDATPAIAVFSVTNSSASGDANIQTCTSFSVTNQTVQIGGILTGACYLRNSGGASFSGKVGVAAYNTSNSLAAVIAQNQTTLASDNTFCVPFSYTVPSSMTTGNYILRPVLSTDNGSSWQPITTAYDNTPTMVSIRIDPAAQPTGNPIIKTTQSFMVYNDNLHPGEMLSGSCYIINDGDGDFNGNVGIAAYNGNSQRIDIIYQAYASLSVGASYVLPFSYTLTDLFSPGSYVLKPIFFDENEDCWINVVNSFDNTPTQISFTVSNLPNNSIENADSRNISVKAIGKNITVTSANNLDVSVIDVMGRIVYKSNSPSDNFVIPMSKQGIYLVMIDGMPAQKVHIR